MSVGGNDDEKVVEGDETKAVLEDLACDPRVAASFWLCVVIWLRQSQVQQSEKRADEGSRLRRVRLVTGDGDGDLEAKSEKSKERPASVPVLQGNRKVCIVICHLTSETLFWPLEQAPSWCHYTT